MDVALVRWPLESARRVELAARGAPRLLLVEGDTAPPHSGDCLEDWLRLPAGDDDIRWRIDALARRAAAHAVAPVPSLDDEGVLRFGQRWVALPPVEARITAALVARTGSLVGRDALATAGWPAGAPGRNALDVHVLRIRRRLAPLGLSIRTVRSRGYLLEAAGLGAGGETDQPACLATASAPARAASGSR